MFNVRMSEIIEGLTTIKEGLSKEDEKKLEKILLSKFNTDISIKETDKLEEDGSKRVWTEDEIKQLIQTNDKVLYGALKHLYACQTEDEKSAEYTKHRNGRGFNGRDSNFLTSVCKQLISKGSLSQKQKEVCRRMLVKYNKQLTRLANE